MTKEEYNLMVDRLTLATLAKKLKWKEDKQHFSTIINECPITIYPDYDPLIGNSSYLLTLANTQGMVFSTYSVDENSDKFGYDRLDNLYAIIKDSIYQIRESEQKILKGLEDLVGE